MPHTTLQQLRDRKRHNQNHVRNNENHANWVSYAAIFVAVGYLTYNSPSMSSIKTSNCVRDSTNTSEWKNDWNKISEWNGFVEDCSANVKISHDDTGFKSDATGDKSIYFMENTRCVTSSYALVNYFCGSDEIAERRASMFYAIKQMVDSGQLNIDGNIKELVLNYFIETLFFSNTSQQGIYRLYIDQNFDKDSLGHVWVIQTLPNNTYNWYQSFIGKYTLRDWMEKENNSFLSKKQLFEKMELIRDIITTNRWTSKINQAYLLLFDVDYHHMLGKEISASIFGKGSGFDNTIQFDWSFECAINA